VPGRSILLLKVLIAEDELLIADVLEEALVASGYNVCGIARTVDEAVVLGRYRALAARLGLGHRVGHRHC